jgi:hypothetical protein
VNNIAENFALARYNSDSSLDASFGDGGLVTTSFGNQYSIAQSVVIQSDGKIVVGALPGFQTAIRITA